MRYSPKIFIFLTSLFAGGQIHASEFEAFSREAEQYQADTMADFAQYKKALEAGFSAYKNAYDEEFSAFKNDISKQWGEFVDSDQKRWVSYVDDNRIKRTIDFETREVSIDIIDGDKLSEQALDALFKKQVNELLNTSEKSAFEHNSVATNVEQRLKAFSSLTKTAVLSDEPIFDFVIAPLVINHSGFIKMANQTVATISSRKMQGQNKSIANIRFKIPQAEQKRAKRFTDSILKSANKEQIPVPLVFAIMETESSFNPMAKSPIPAFGLMQIVPRSAGKDASKYLYGKSKMLSPSYLYKSEKNIAVGSAYLHILYYRYLKRIDNPISRLYCAIAAYNTGAGNVAKAFIGSRNINRASKKINEMEPKEVYLTLLKNLPYVETQKYLKKVTTRMAKYQQRGV